MKYAFWGFGLIMAGLFGIAFIVMFEGITINNESEYYVLKEAMEASMIESVDLACYRTSYIASEEYNNYSIEGESNSDGCGGALKISEQKFVENFTRRFAASVSGDVKQYKIDFYDIIEMPPKATVKITGTTQDYFIFNAEKGEEFNIVNNLTGILEFNDGKYSVSVN